jgi:LPS-assembly protein
MDIRAVTQSTEGRIYRLRGAAELETIDMLLRASEIDYNEETGQVSARGNVRFVRFDTGERLQADRVEYDLSTQSGRFYNIRGVSPPKPPKTYQPGLLTTTHPYYFQGDWAERIRNRYVLYNGFLTNCRLPNPWWRIKGPKFDIAPGERAIGYQTTFRVRGVPVFYTPAFYKSLESAPRRSGFLLPNIGNTSRWGQVVGLGYYWAINRSYDATYRWQWFTERGFAHNVEVRGKPSQRSDFSAVIFGVNDRGFRLPSGERIPQGGFQVTGTGYAELPWGFQSRGEVNYLSSFVFRQAFTQTFNEAVFSEVHSVGFVTRHWSANSLNFVFERGENYQSTEPGDRIVIRKLPSVEFHRRDTKLAKSLPFWWSLESSASLVRRNQPLFQTRQFVERIDFAPRVMTAVRWKDFNLLPYFSLRETHYGSSFTASTAVAGDGILRSTTEAGAELLLPSLARVYDGPRWLGERVKHVIETRAGFRWVRGVDDFSRIIRFDELDLLANTREMDYSVTQRLYAKRAGVVQEVWSWELRQARYFDPTFGGAIEDGRRNVLESQIRLTGYSFLDSARDYSPVASSMRIAPTPNLGVEWRSDYDPLRRRIANSGIIGNFRRDNLFISGGHYQVRSSPILSPSANQLLALIGWGRPNMRGWSAGFTSNYDFRENRMQFATTQVTYNSECCGLSFQYRRFNFGARQENQFRVAFAIANIGSFGTLRVQERLF